MTRVPLSSLHEDPDNHPPEDEAFINLLVAAVRQEIPVYWAGVPVRYLRPFSPSFKPIAWEPWAALLATFKDAIVHEHYQPLLVYQVGDFFVVSDDYPAYYAYLETGTELASCFILGTPSSDNISGTRLATEKEFKAISGLG